MHPVGKVKTQTSEIPGRQSPLEWVHAKARGFTLVELLVVFAIGALLTVLVPIAFDKLRESTQYRETLRAMITDLRTARYLAMSEAREVRFTVDFRQRAYGIVGGRMHALPEPLAVKATVASIELVLGEAASILFLPSGGATGGSFEIVRPSGAGTRIDVDWFSGRASQSAFSP